MTVTDRFVLRVDQREEAIDRVEQLRQRLSELTRGDDADVELLHDIRELQGFQRTLYRLLGLKTRLDGDSVYMLSRGDRAVLVFLDEDGDEAIAVNRDYDGPADAGEEFRLATGEVALHDADTVLPLQVAVDAMIDFFEHDGRRPEWLAFGSGA